MGSVVPYPVAPNQPGADFHTGGVHWAPDDGVRWLAPDQYALDGIGPVPVAVARVLAEGPPAWRLARFGYLRGIVTHDFGPPIGPRQVYVMEKYALVHLPDNAPPWDCQGVSLGLLPGILSDRAPA